MYLPSGDNQKYEVQLKLNNVFKRLIHHHFFLENNFFYDENSQILILQKPLIRRGILAITVQKDDCRIQCQTQSCFSLVRLQRFSLVEHLFVFERG